MTVLAAVHSRSSRPGFSARWVIWLFTPLVLLALWPSGLTLIRFWRAITDYQYGILAAALCLVWLFIIAHRLGYQAARADPRVLPPLLLACIAWTAMFLACSDMLHQLLMPVVLWLVIRAVAGRTTGRAVAEPIACLYLAMPLWDYLLPFLQRATVVVTEGALKLIGIPATVMINRIRIPEGTFEVVEGCAGKKYLMVTITLSVLAGAYFRLSPRGRVILIAAGAVLALLTNWLRVVIIVVAGHLTNMQHYLVAKEHLTFGTALFAALIVLLGLFARWLTVRMPAPAPVPVTVPVAADTHRFSKPQYVTLMTLAPLAALAIPLAASLRSAPISSVQLGTLPLLSDVWQGPLPPSTAWQPKFIGASEEMRAAYRSPSGSIELYVNVYGPQRIGRELVSFNNELLAPGVWQLELAAPLLPALKTQVVEKGDALWVVAHVYRVGGRSVQGDLAAQLRYGARELFGNPASGIVALAAQCQADCESASHLLEAFWRRHGTIVVTLVPASYSLQSP